MTLVTLIMQIALTIPLTLILNLCKKNNNRIDQIIIPTIYIIIVSALIPDIKENVFLIVVFELFIRNFYITNIATQNNIEGAKNFVINGVLSIALSLFTYNYFISNVDNVIPNPEEIKTFLWFIIILYIANIYKKQNKESELKESKKTTIRKKEQIIMQYAKYKSKYNDIVKSKYKIINELVYAIMVYETIKTPLFYRKVEEYVGAVTKKETKYGIMRVPSYTHLTDEQSICSTIEVLENKLKEQDNSKINFDELLSNYSKQDKENIVNICNDISDFSKK